MENEVRIRHKHKNKKIQAHIADIVRVGGGGILMLESVSFVALPKHHLLPEYRSGPDLSSNEHCVLMADCDGTMHQVPELKSSQADILNVTMSSLYSTVTRSQCNR